MHARHLSAEQLEFLKQAYQKEAPWQHGGHTLDLLNGAIARRFAGLRNTDFAARLRRDLAAVEEGLEDQKARFTNAFVDAERERLNARLIEAKPDGSAAPLAAQTHQHRQHQTYQGREGRHALARPATAPTNTVSQVQRCAAVQADLASVQGQLAALKRKQLQERARGASRPFTAAPLSIGAAAGNLGSAALARLNAASVPTADRPNRRFSDQQHQKNQQQQQQKSSAQHSGRSAKGGEHRRRRRAREFAGQERMRQRSELEKRATLIPPAECYRFHLDSQFRSSSKHAHVDLTRDADLRKTDYIIRDTNFTKYADGVVMSPDLRSPFHPRPLA